MTEQPEALRLADALERAAQQIDAEDNVVHVARWFVEDAADELRRLHSVNAQLLEALELAEAGLADIGDADREPGDDLEWCERRAAKPLPVIRAAIAAAKEMK